MDRLKGRAQALLLLAGLALFFLAVRSAGGAERLKIIFPVLTGPGLLFLAIYPFTTVWDVWGWQVVFPRHAAGRARFGELFYIRIAGEALNNITPFVDIGGEFLKVLLVSSRLSLDKRTAVLSVIMTRTALFFSEILFWFAGLALLFGCMTVPGEWRWALLATAAVCGILVLVISRVQRKGFFSGFLGWLEHLRLDKKMLERFQVPLRQIDDEVAAFYSGKDARLLGTIGLHFLGWVAGGFEMWALFYLAGAPVSLVQAMVLETLLQMVRTASFFIPGNLGAQEAGLALFVQWMGHHPSLGVAVSLLKRIRQLFWTGAGFGIWGIYQLLERREKV